MYENRYGRFTAVDPLLASGKSGNPQTFNRYVYVLNSPLIHTDPTGLQVGKWYRQVNADGSIKPLGSISYLRDGVSTEGYEEITTRNRAGDLIAEDISLGGKPLGPDFVARLNPYGPASINNPFDLDDLFFHDEYVSNGFQIIRSDASEDTFIEHPADGYVRGAEIVFTPIDIAALMTPFKFGGATRGVAAVETTGSRSLPILNPNFTPDPIKVGQNFTNLANSQLSSNPALFRSVLSPAEYAAGQNSSRVAIMNWGKGVERQFWQNVDSPMNPGRSLFQRLGGPGRPDGTAGGIHFDITTRNPFTVKQHFARPYPRPLKLFQYQRPANFRTF